MKRIRRLKWIVNVVMTGSGEFIEVQGTAERRPFSERRWTRDGFGRKGIEELFGIQRKLVGDILSNDAACCSHPNKKKLAR
jgi:hypothetical protein